jgi:DNA modification methylase
MNKETKYYKPDSIGAMRSYKDPLRVNGVKASIIYNEIKDDDMPAINLEERNRIIKVKVDISKKNIDRIQNLYPETYKKILTLLSSNNPIGKDLNTVALPLDVNIPDWLLAFVDVNSIINDSLKNFPLDSIGLSRLNNDSVNYSNIISL